MGIAVIMVDGITVRDVDVAVMIVMDGRAAAVAAASRHPASTLIFYSPI